MARTKSSLSAATDRPINLEFRDKHHKPQVAPKPPREQVRRVAKITPERWRISRELAAVRGAARIVAGFYQRRGATFERLAISEDSSGCREIISGRSASMSTDAQVHAAGLVAETLFWQQPPIEYRDDDYRRIRNVASCIKYSNPKMTLSEIVERILRETVDVLTHEHLAVARVASALLERGDLDGDELSRLLQPSITDEAIDDLPLDAQEMREKLEAVLAQHPMLSLNGYERTSGAPFNLRRFALAYLFCVRIEKVKAINRHRTSYALKHIAERLAGTYISNGDLIAAAIAAGFRFRRCPCADLNVQLNMSEKSIKALLSERTAT
jgi:hypothetical protein